MDRKIINIGVLAHVDAGKTTLTESLLFLGGVIKNIGNVDKGTSQTDFLDIEKQRGISIRSATATFVWENVQINLIDTPGHIDFSADIERSIRILDAAILIISAVEGVQAHTENIWMALQTNKIPTIIFINKIDQTGADTLRIIDEIKIDITSKIAILQQSINEGNKTADVKTIWDNDNICEDVVETIANNNDAILEKYLNEETLSFDELNNELTLAVSNFRIIPVMMGSAKNMVGVSDLLNSIVHYLPGATGNQNNKLSALVYKIDHNKKFGKAVGIKLYDGKINTKDIVVNKTQNIEEKINKIARYNAGKFTDINTVTTGDIAVVFGLNNAKVGDIIGTGKNIPGEVKLESPLLTVQVRANNKSDYPALTEALTILSTEDPALEFEWFRENKELHIKIMGWIQIQVLEKTLEQRFGIATKFDDPTIIYKETPKKTAVGFARYWMPKPCWAIIKLKIEPGEPGSGVIYNSIVSVNDIQKKYQNEVERTIEKALKQGPKGWEVTDLKITLIEGEDHTVHSNPGDFIIATPMAVMNGLLACDTKFLEPIMWFRIVAPEELLGAITSDIINMRGTFESPIINNGKFTIEGTVPMATSLDFPVKLSSRSGGRAKIKTRFHSYQECPNEFGVTTPYKGISPVDEAKYILKARKAITEGINSKF